MSTWPSGYANAFYIDQDKATLTDNFQQFPFGFISRSISVYNDSDDSIKFSFDGKTIHGKLLKKEALVMDNRAQSGIYLSADNAGSFRVMAY